jgi:hypothetical protein
MSDADALSRRQFLAACGAVGASAASASAASAARDQQVDSRPSPLSALSSAGAIAPESGNPGTISPTGQARIAAVDRQFQQQGGSINQTLDAVNDLGFDPSGSSTNDEKFRSELDGLSNARVEFPGDGVFRVSDQTTINFSGPVELIGNGCTIQLDANTERRIFNISSFPSGSLMQGFTLTCTSDTTFGLRVETDGTARIQDITAKGYMRSDQSNRNELSSVLAPTATSSSATLQVKNFRAIGGGSAGTHDQKDLPDSAPENQIATPLGVWVGDQTQGTIQLVDCQLRGWSNGVYGGRTNGRVEVSGGQYWNNLNSQLRLGGGSIIDGATLLLDDREWSMDKNPGPYSLGEKQGVHAVRVDAKGGNMSDPIRLRNVRVQSKSMNQGVAEIEFEDQSGPGILENCHITSHIDRPMIAAKPSSGSGPSNISATNCLFDGNDAPTAAMRINGRSQSRIQQSCIALPGAGPDMISGAQIGDGVGFGEQCRGSGLSNPSKVGSGGNISSLPAPNSTGAGVAARGVSGPSRKKVQQKNRRRTRAAIFSFVAAGAGLALFMLGGVLMFLKFVKN